MNDVGHLTVVFTYKNTESFKDERERLFKLLQSYDMGDPPDWGITAISNDNEIHRVSLIEDAVSNADFSMVDKLLSCANVDTFLRQIKLEVDHEAQC